jgi:hypothetical protein
LLVLSHTVIVLADSAGRLTNYAVFPCIRAGSTSLVGHSIRASSSLSAVSAGTLCK